MAGGSAIPSGNPLVLGEFPLVVGFVKDKEAYLVTYIVEIRVLGVVACADAVHSHILEDLEPGLPYLRRHCGAKDTGIVVQADAFDLHPSAIEGEAPVGVKGK